MCHQKNHSSLFYQTFSSNAGLGLCCRNKVTYNGICGGKDENFTCSMSSNDTNPNSKYKDVLSEGNRNH